MSAMVALIEKYGSDVVEWKDGLGQTVLHAACLSGSTSAVKVALESGGDINTPAGSTGYTPLYIAAQEGHPDIVNYLLENGADVTIGTQKGRTVLHAAALSQAEVSRCEDVIDILLCSGIAPSRDATGRYPSSFVNASRNAHIASLLSSWEEEVECPSTSFSADNSHQLEGPGSLAWKALSRGFSLSGSLVAPSILSILRFSSASFAHDMKAEAKEKNEALDYIDRIDQWLGDIVFSPGQLQTLILYRVSEMPLSFYESMGRFLWEESHLDQCSSICSMEFVRCEPVDGILSIFSHPFPAMQRLQSLRVDGSLSYQGLDRLTRQLQLVSSNFALVHFSAVGCMAGRATFTSRKEQSKELAQRMAGLLSVSSDLSSLTLPRMHLDNVTAGWLLQSLTQLSSLDLSRNGLGKVLGEKLVHFVGRSLVVLTTLKLSHNMLGDKAAKALINELTHSSSVIEQLDLSFNQLGDDTLLVLGSWIALDGMKLKELLIEGNRFSPFARTRFVAELESNAALQKCWLSELSEVEQRRMLHRCERNRLSALAESTSTRTSSSPIKSSLSSPSPLTPRQVQPPEVLQAFFSAPLVMCQGSTLTPLPTLRLEEERDSLVESVLTSQSSVRLSMDIATTERIRKAMTSMGASMVALHYSGHGSADGLILEDANGAAHVVGGRTLGQLLSAGGTIGRIKFCFVSACHSWPIGEAFLEAGIPSVIAVETNMEIRDVSARCFTSHLYLALLHGKSIREAFEIGKAAVKSSSEVGASAEADKFILMGSQHDVPVFRSVSTIHDGQLLSIRRPPSMTKLPATFHITEYLQNVTSHESDDITLRRHRSIQLYQSPLLPEDFFGRQVLVYRVIKLLRQQRRFVTLYGPRGVGKSTVATAIAAYVSERRFFFRDGTLLLRCCSTLHFWKQLWGQISAYDNVTGDKTDDLQESCLQRLRKRKRLLIVDNIDVLGLASSELLSICGSLLETNVQLLLVRTVPCGGHLVGVTEVLVKVPPLSVEDSIAVLLRKCRRLRSDEMGLQGRRNGELTVAEAYRTLLQHPVLTYINGIPSHINNVAQLLEQMSMPEVMASLTVNPPP